MARAALRLVVLAGLVGVSAARVGASAAFDGAARGLLGGGIAGEGGVDLGGGSGRGRRTAEILRFGAADDVVEQAYVKIINGRILLQGEVPSNLASDMAVPVRGAIAEVTGLEESMVIVVFLSSGNPVSHTGRPVPVLDMHFSYSILPPENAAPLIAAALEYSFMYPPLSKFVNDVIVHTRAYAPTSDIWMDGIDWSSSLETTPTANYAMVFRPKKTFVWGDTTSPTPAPTAAATTRPPTTTPAPAAVGDVSCWAELTPCRCAALPSCAWVQDYGGVSQCLVASEVDEAPGALCSECPTQETCTSGCGVLPSPCSCAQSDRNCRWDTASRRCRDRDGGSTPCTACGAQPGCDPPLIVGYVPGKGSLLRMPANLWIRVNFNREIRLGSANAATLRCSGLAKEISARSGHIATSGVQLQVNIQGLLDAGAAQSGESEWDCSLSLADGVVYDVSGVPFVADLGSGPYAFRLSDAVAPFIKDGVLSDGAASGTGASVAFTFNEGVFFASSANGMSVRLTALDAAGAIASEVVFAFSPPLVQVNGQVLTVDLSSEDLKQGVLYSLSLPAGSLVDAAGNSFEGLPFRIFTFRVGVVLSSGSGGGDQGSGQFPPEVGWAAAGVGSFAVLGICGFYTHRAVRLRRGTADTRTLVKSSVVRPARAPQPYAAAPEPLRRSATTGPRFAGSCTQDAPKSPSGTPFSPETSWGSGTWANSMGGANSAGSRREGSSPHRATLRRPTSVGPAPPDRRGSSGAGPAAAGGGPASGNRAQGASPASPTGAARARAASHDPPRAEDASKSSRAQQPPQQSQQSQKQQQWKQQPQQQQQRTSTKVFMAEPDNRGEGGEVGRKKAELEQKLRGLMSEPIAERKKVLRELMLEYHPDKNKAAHATEIFQYINSSRAWFLA